MAKNRVTVVAAAVLVVAAVFALTWLTTGDLGEAAVVTLIPIAGGLISGTVQVVVGSRRRGS